MERIKEKIAFEFLGKTFENPFLLAATPSTDDEEMLREAFEAGWAGAVIKTTSVESNEVNLKYPMMSGIKDRYNHLMTLGNIDLISEHPVNKVEKMIKNLKEEYPGKIIIASIMGKDKKEWQTLTRRLIKAGADMIECSFSCPQGNIGEDPGKMLSQSAKATEIATDWVKSAAKSVPVLIKLTPQVTDIAEIAQAVKNGGGDAVVVSNSVLGLIGIDIETGKPLPTVNGYGGFAGITGPSVKPITLKNIIQVAQNVDIPIFGVGGVSTYKDAIELMMAGASVVQIGTEAMHYGFRIIDSLVEGLYNFLERKKYKNVSSIVGKSLKYIIPHDEMPYKDEDAPVANINQEKCIQCKICYIACRQGGHRAIYLEDNKVYVDEEKCFGCGFCPTVCPVDAISLKKRKKSKTGEKVSKVQNKEPKKQDSNSKDKGNMKKEKAEKKIKKDNKKKTEKKEKKESSKKTTKSEEKKKTKNMNKSKNSPKRNKGKDKK